MLAIRSRLISKRKREGRSGVSAIPCPCCGHEVAAPSLPMIVSHYGLTPLQAAILGAVWDGKGLPVSTERILNRMYEDDIDGGPDGERQYNSLKEGMSRIRKQLQGSGISIVSAGAMGGWKLKIERQAPDTLRKRPGRGRQKNAPPRRLDVDDTLALASIRAGSNPREVAWRLAGPRSQLRDSDRHYKRLMRKLAGGKNR